MGLCACCVVCEVSRGPHAGETARVSTTAGAPSQTLAVGRRGACWLRLLRDLEVSGLHAELLLAPGPSLRVRDCASTNGTRVNGVAAAAGQELALRDQDLVQFGRSVVRVRLGDVECPRAGDAPAEKPAVEAAEKEQEQQAREHEDRNAFEEAAAPEVCVVCGQRLSVWSVLERHLHINACLDRRSDVVALPLTAVTTTTAIVAAPTGRKRKRQATLRKTEDEELAVALALSESLVDKEQQVDMEMALVSVELLQVDAQLKKLQKKRLALVRKLEKLEKAKRKVHKGEVLAPLEARELLNVAWALRVLFPAPREAGRDAKESPMLAVRPGVARLLALYRATAAAEAYVTMWQRCMQREEHDGDDLYANQLMKDLRAREDPPRATAETETLNEAGNAGLDVAEEDNQTVQDERPVPEVVKRVFPNWRENLAFLTTQDDADLRDALDEMRRMRAERRASDESAEGDDEDEACVFFEAEMVRLIAEREEIPGDQGVEVVELITSPDDEMEPPPEPGEPEAIRSPLVLSIDDSSSDEEPETSDSVGAATTDESRAEPERELESDEISPPPPSSAVSSSPSTEAGRHRCRDGSSSSAASATDDASLDKQLLAALKANAPLYEAVLLLQPLDLASLLAFFRDEAGIACAKAALVRFCDRHGISFKS